MNSLSSLKADWVSPPGSSLIDFIEERGSSVSELAEQMNCNVQFLERFINGNEILDTNLANSLSSLTGASAKFWLTRENQYRDNVHSIHQRIESEKAWLSELPLADMVKFGWIQKATSIKQKLKNCFDFFEISSIDQWQLKYTNIIAETAFRTSETFSHKTESVAAWLRQGQIQTTNQICEPWNKSRLESLVPTLRTLTNDASPLSFIPKLQELLATCGVLLAVVPTPKNCPASGASYWLSESKALIVLSFRYKTDDHFWFTFFHEIGHLLLHPTYSLILESSDSTISAIENEANKFSENVLIPSEYQLDLNELTHKNLRGILKFAKKIGISKGIVVGQLQYKSIVSKSALNKLKVRYSWERSSSL